jgi:hypothetical protein
MRMNEAGSKMAVNPQKIGLQNAIRNMRSRASAVLNMWSGQVDSDTRRRYFRQSAVHFALAAWQCQVSHKLGLLFSPCSLYRALAVPTLEVLPKFRDIFLSTLRLPSANFSVDDMAAAVGDVASNLKSDGNKLARRKQRLDQRCFKHQ